MTHHDDEAQHRSHFQADSDRVSVREGEDDGDGLFRVRMPVSSTAEARDGDAFTRDRLRGFADQIADGDVGVFLDHGRSGLGSSRYSALGKVGYWTDADVVDRDAGADLVADAVLMDPAELDADVGDLREALATLKAQAELGVPLASSVGWSENTGDRDVAGGADLLEISIVGIPSDPRTTTASAGVAAARAASAASSDLDIDQFVAAFREAITSEDLQDATPVAVDGHTPDTTGRAEYDVDGETVDITPPEAVQNAATLALTKADEVDADCGTGVGSQRARQIAGDDVGPDVVDEVAAYLTSHEEDVTADGPPSDWSNEEWADCGNLQYAKWGGTGTGTGLEWAQRTANAVAEARGEELPYPDQAARNLDDPEFSEGDAVEWSSNDTTVRGRVADIGAEFEPAEGVVITGDEGEAVYLIHELDDSLEPPQYRRENVAKPESSLDESQADLPPLEGNFTDEDNSMSSDTDTESTDEQSADTDRDEQPDLRAMEEEMAEMREQMEENTRMTREMYEEMMGGDSDEEAADEDGDGGMEGDEDDDEASADAGEQRTVTLDGEEMAVDDARDHIEDLRSEVADAEPAEPETQDRAAEDAADSDDDQTSGFGMAARMED